MVAGGATPLVNSAEACNLGFKIVIWPCFAMTTAYLAYQQAAKELQTTGVIAEHRGGPNDAVVVGGVRELFEPFGLSEFTSFDKEMGGKALQMVFDM
jgi:2-methylisocitrate lyase-like PEP mutase family enzyme